MISDLQQLTSSGNLSAGIEPEASINAVVTFIKTNFKEFSLKNRQAGALNEKGLNQRLCIFLNMKIQAEPFFFHHEFMENPENGNSPQVDIGTISKPGYVTVSDREYHEGDSFFSIEAKRLPTGSADREKEYVTGLEKPSGAIERYKKCLHGPRLKYAAIVGYIQDKNFEYWFFKINTWITELAAEDTLNLWHNTDILKQINDISISKEYAELVSDNSRINGTENITLFHFWISLI